MAETLMNLVAGDSDVFVQQQHLGDMQSSLPVFAEEISSGCTSSGERLLSRQ
jgi:hypothetical protein